MSESKTNIEFTGHPRQYLRICIVLSAVWLLWIYGGTALVQYLWNGSTGLLGWKPMLGALLFTAWYTRWAYRWMMRGDAQWGKGSGWVLVEKTVKLPELKS